MRAILNSLLIGVTVWCAPFDIEGFIKKGALVGVVADYQELGRAAASIVDRHQKGETLGAIQVIWSSSPTRVVNRATSQVLGVSVPHALNAKYVD